MSRRPDRGAVRRTRCGAKRGFTVLEALIALVIVGFAVVTTVEALGGGLRAEGQVSRHLEAVALADARMNALAALPRDSLAYYATARDGVFAPPLERYGWRAVIEPVDSARTLLRARVTVGWEGRSYALETIFYHPPVSAAAPPAPRVPSRADP